MKFAFLVIAIFINFFNHSLIKSEEKIFSAKNKIENIARKESITEEKTEFDVVLESFDAAAKIKVLKVVRNATGLGLGDAKALVESAPKTVKEGIAKADAESLKKEIEEAGGKVTLK